jgi:8-oxo-dGTP diphosphatase
MNALIRFGYRLAYRLLIVHGFFVRPHHDGALVALWYEGRILLVRSSYRRGWSLPGGGLHRGETPLAAALREAREELALDLDPSTLNVEQDRTFFHEYRHDHAVIFAVGLTRPPAIRIDAREIVEAAFHTPQAALALRIPPYLREYLTVSRPAALAAAVQP